jgi:hypothetical protein
MSLWQEYAIEPSLLSDYNQARYILSGFGIDTGRLVGGFPRKWEREVRRQAATMTDIQRAVIVERLVALQGAIRARRHDYDGSRPWKEQAFECHAALPFHALLVNGPDAHPRAIDATTALDAHPQWRTARKCSVPRTAQALVDSIGFLLTQCHTVDVVDREFIPSGGTRNKWLNPVRAIAEALRSNERLVRFGVHTLDKPIYPWPAGKFIADCEAHLPTVLPNGMPFAAKLWGQREGGIQFHERLILTDIGGVLIDPGIDEGKAGETYDLRLLSVVEIGDYLQRFQDRSSAYELVAAFRVNC